MTSHPIDMTESLINVHKTNDKLMPFLHLPIQSGSDKVLKEMNRKHTIKFYRNIVDKLRSVRSDLALSSDFIVGYPNESDKDFEDTMKFISEVKFVVAYSFMYSQRPGTPAQRQDNILLADKKARLAALQSLLREQQKNYNKTFIGKNMEILFEKKGRYKNQYIGRSIYNQSVFATSNSNLINKIQNVTIANSTDFALESLI
jgi:tRNA-2-methylthio-N6-dimethylallyladenosine synthase